MKNLEFPRIQFVACHRRPDRSFFYKDKQFPVCARCTGMLLGYLSFPMFVISFFQLGLVSALLLNLPAYLDGTSQAMGWRESTNPLRFFTGVLSGIGQIAIMSIIGQAIGLFILNHFIKGGV